MTEENIYIPLWRKLKRIFLKYDSQFAGQSYRIVVDFAEPNVLPKFRGEDILGKVKLIHDSERKKFPVILKLGDGLFFENL